jgi:hypothetical protein
VVQLTNNEKHALATAAIEVRFDSEQAEVSPHGLLIPYRPEDRGNDLWTTFNVVQENLIRGGVGYTTRNSKGRKVYRRSRPVRGIDGDLKLNRALWRQAEELRKTK